MASDDKEVCPLCMEAMEADDLAFYPCDCRYQVCRFCWAKIINEENGLCPACRKEYNSEKPAIYKPVSDSDDSKLKCSRKRKEHLKKTKMTAEMLKLLPELRVVQPNLIFVVGLPPWICKDKEILKGPEYFGRYGKVFKVEINQNQTFGGPQGQPSFSAYITYCRAEDAMRSIRELDQGMIHGRPLRVSLGTTKYCSQFLRGAKCTKHECMYLHELGDPAASFTKEEMQAGKHTEYMNKLLVDYVATLQALGSSSALHSDDPTFNASDSNNVSAPISACDSTEDGSTRTHGPKDMSHPHIFTRSRSRLDGPTSSHSQSFQSRSQPKRNVETEYHGKNANGENRRSRQHRSDCYLYSGSPPIGRSTVLGSVGKSGGVWNPSDCPNAIDSKQVASSRLTPRDGTHTYMNGYDCPEQDKPERKAGDHRRIHSTRVDQNRSGLISLTSGSFSAAAPPVSNANFPDTAQSQTNWRSGISPCESSGNLNDEPVDIGFDPFRESQQGLAELLAAEVDRLNVVDDASSRATYHINGQLPLRASMEQFRSHCNPGIGSPGTRSGDFNIPPNRLAGYQWDSAFSYQPDDGHVSSGDHQYSSRAYPPPGFEDGTSAVRQTVNASSFFSSSEPSNQCDPNLSSSPYSFMSMVGLNTSNAASTNGPSHDSTSLFQSFPHADGKFNPTSFEFNSQTKGFRTADPSSMRSYQQPMVDSSMLRPDSQQQQQAIANLFAAAFNTASVMLNNRIPLPTDGKSPATAPKITPPFDLNAFFSQLCRQSPLFAALSTGSTAPSSDSWANINGTGRSWEHPVAGSFGDCPNSLSAAAAAASLLFQSARVPSKSMESDGNSYRQDGLAFTNCNLAPNFPFPADSSGDKGSYGSSVENFKSSFDASTSAPFASSSQPSTNWKQSPSSTSPADLLQHMWQSGSTVQNSFDAHIQTAPYGVPSQTNPSDSQSSSGSAISPRQTLRDPSVHTTSHAQSAE